MCIRDRTQPDLRVLVEACDQLRNDPDALTREVFGALLELDGEARDPVAASFPSGGDPTACLLYTSPSPRDRTRSRMPSSA